MHLFSRGTDKCLMLRLGLSIEARGLFLSQMKIVSYYLRVRPIGKRVSNEGRNPHPLVGLCPAFWPFVKKGPNGRFQGSVPGEIAFGNFPIRLWKSLK